MSKILSVLGGTGKSEQNSMYIQQNFKDSFAKFSKTISFFYKTKWKITKIIWYLMSFPKTLQNFMIVNAVKW